MKLKNEYVNSLSDYFKKELEYLRNSNQSKEMKKQFDKVEKNILNFVKSFEFGSGYEFIETLTLFNKIYDKYLVDSIKRATGV